MDHLSQPPAFRSHVVISGTGRAGTTFLVQLLTRLGLDTGFDRNLEVLPSASAAQVGPRKLLPAARAGLEMDIRSADAPYIVKSPHLCDRLEKGIGANVRIEHAIIPVRQFAAAAASRAHVQKLSAGKFEGEKAPGGLWGTQNAEEQAAVLREKFTRLIEVLVRLDIPITFLSYPRLVRDPDYLREKLAFLLHGIDRATFRSAFEDVVRPEWVNQFSTADRFDASQKANPRP